MDAGVVGGTAAPRRLRLPDGRRWPALGQADARQQPSHHTVPNDQIRWHHRLAQTTESHGVVAGGSQRQQHRLGAERGRNAHHAVVRDDEPRAGAAKDIAHAQEAVRTRDKDRIADPDVAGRADAHHSAHRLIARHQRVTQAGKGRHRTVPQQSLGARADATGADLNFQVVGLERLEFQSLHRQGARSVEDDGAGLGHGVSPTGLMRGRF